MKKDGVSLYSHNDQYVTIFREPSYSRTVYEVPNENTFYIRLRGEFFEVFRYTNGWGTIMPFDIYRERTGKKNNIQSWIDWKVEECGFYRESAEAIAEKRYPVYKVIGNNEDGKWAEFKVRIPVLDMSDPKVQEVFEEALKEHGYSLVTYYPIRKLHEETLDLAF